MIVKIALLVVVSMVFSFANVAYGSAVIKGEKDTVECPFCITIEELEFRNNHPELVDRIGKQMIIFSNIGYPGWSDIETKVSEIKLQTENKNHTIEKITKQF